MAPKNSIINPRTLLCSKLYLRKKNFHTINLLIFLSSLSLSFISQKLKNVNYESKLDKKSNYKILLNDININIDGYYKINNVHINSYYVTIMISYCKFGKLNI